MVAGNSEQYDGLPAELGVWHAPRCRHRCTSVWCAPCLLQFAVMPLLVHSVPERYIVSMLEAPSLSVPINFYRLC